MKRVLPTVTVFLFGGGLYCCLEVLWRGFSHPSMAVVGGLCIVAISFLDGLRCPTALKMLLAGLAVTLIEGVSGLVINLLWGWNVWDYSAYSLNLYGQVCLMYFFVWVLLAYPGMLFCRVLQRYVFT
ncbi:MAG: hypothetical protein E7599_03035 [Ruminococcaceae bacterium]|nr:hypothetical protein [Oscillospiraceae bacterium]